MNGTQSKPATNTALIVGIVVLLLCICLLVLGVGGYIFYTFAQSIPFQDVTPGLPFGPATSTPSVSVTRVPVGSISSETLETLETTIVPNNIPPDLSCRLEGKCNIPESLAPPAAPRKVGDTDQFWVTNVDTNENFKADATLRYVTPHVYFWVETSVDYNANELKALADAFENKIYPTDREFFGSEWTPGIDGDPHIYILYVRGMGFSIAGR